MANSVIKSRETWNVSSDANSGSFFIPEGVIEFYYTFMSGSSTGWQRIGPMLVAELSDGTHWDASGGWFYTYYSSNRRFWISNVANGQHYQATQQKTYWR